MERSNLKGRAYQIELFVSGLGLAVCLITNYLIWRSVAPNQGMWLLPGLYFIELAAGAAICFLAYTLQYPGASTISWIYCGVLGAFIVLAGFSVGFLYTPVFLIFAGISIYSTIKDRQNMFTQLGILVLSILVQLAFMLFFVRFLG